MNQYILLAKQTVENFVKNGSIISPPKDLPKEFSRSELAELLKRKAGTFVTIEKNSELRGCIGTYLPTKENIAEEIIHNAIAAATEDYRFGPITKEELSQLSYTVYILSEPEFALIKEVSDPPKFFFEKLKRAGLEPRKFGIIVKTAPIIPPNAADVMFNGHMPYKSGLLLPNLGGIDTIEKQISIACQKGGIDPMRERILIYRFTVEKYTE